MTEQELVDHFLSLAIENKHFTHIKNALALGANTGALKTPLRQAIKTGDVDTLERLIEFGISPEIRDVQSFARLSPSNQNNSQDILSLLLTEQNIAGIAASERLVFSLFSRLLENYQTDILKQYINTVWPNLTFSASGLVLLFDALETSSNNRKKWFLAAFDCAMDFILEDNVISKIITQLDKEQIADIEKVLLLGANEKQFTACRNSGLFTSRSDDVTLIGIRNPRVFKFLKEQQLEPVFENANPYPFMHEDEYVHLGQDISLCTSPIKVAYQDSYAPIEPDISHTLGLLFHHVAAHLVKTDFDMLVTLLEPYKEQNLDRYIERFITSTDYAIPLNAEAVMCYDVFIAKVAKHYSLTLNLGSIAGRSLSLGAIPRCIHLFARNTLDSNGAQDYFDKMQAFTYVQDFTQHATMVRDFVDFITNDERLMMQKSAYRSLGYSGNKTVNQLCANLNKTQEKAYSNAYLKLLLLLCPHDEIIDNLKKVRTYDTLILCLTLLGITPLDALAREDAALNSHQRNLILQSLSRDK